MSTSAKRLGYELSKIELWNFGTYNSYQIIPLTHLMPGSLFDLHSHVMFTGKNGSGKSTLMDLVWIALLPDERLLRLGVVETASPEGKKSAKGVRSTTDYVLGKYLSGDDTDSASEKSQSPYLRSDGASAILLTLTHRETGKSVSVGRQWWYGNRILKADQAFFVGRENFSINGGKFHLMDAKGKPYESARMFAKGMKATYDSLVEIPSKGIDYTRILGELFGGIDNDDIVLLMKAANAKAIDNVNHFVRDFILAPPKDQAIDSLMDRIKETSFLAKKIKTTTEMFQLSKLIVEDFDKAEANFEALHQAKVKAKLVDVHAFNVDHVNTHNEKQKKEKESKQCKEHVEKLTSQILVLDDEEKSLAMRVNSSDTAAKLREIDSQMNKKIGEIGVQVRFLSDAQVIAQKNNLILPADHNGREGLLQEIEACLQKVSIEIKELEEKRIEASISLKEVTETRRRKKDDLDYLENHKTAFPQDLYEIKLNMMKDLGISEKDVMFVGELFMVPIENKIFDRAIKAVFSGIAARLIVHPQYEREADAWLNQYKNKRRIGIQNLKDYSLAKRPIASSLDESVLSKIKFRDPSESSFYYAVREWLQNDFDVMIVPIEEFSRNSHMVVTKEGFVKLNSKYRIKHGERIDAPIGWDTEQKAKELKAEIAEFEIELKKLEGTILKGKLRNDEMVLNRTLLSQLKDSGLGFLDVPKLKADLAAMEIERQDILKNDVDFKKNQKRWEEARQRHKEAIAAEAAQKQKIVDLESEILKLESKLVEVEKLILNLANEKISRDLSLNDLYQDTEMDDVLNELKEEIEKSGLIINRFKEEVASKIQNLQNGGRFGSLIRQVLHYKTVHKDNNLQYELNVMNEDTLKSQAEGWRQHLRYLEDTELPSCHEEWNKVYSTKLWESIRDFIDDHKKSVEKINEDVEVLNSGIKDMKFEKSFLELHLEPATSDQRIKDFKRLIDTLEKIFTARFKAMDAKTQAGEIETFIDPFEKFMSEGSKREFATDPRNHFIFSIRSIRKGINGASDSVETFKGSSKDAKSGGQTVQLCYVLLSMALAQRFHFNDAIRGKNTLRFIILDEFADKLDNEKPEGIVKLFSDMGFQAILLTPYSKVDLLRPMMNKVISVIKNQDTQHSKAAEIDIDNLTPEQKEALMDDDEIEVMG